MNLMPHNKGITLIEAIVAVTILAVAIVGPMTLAAQSLRASRDTRNELIATHLAEEGIEVIHNLRDNNVTNYPSGSWLVNILPGCGAAGCGVDVTQGDTTLVWNPGVVLPCTPDCSAVGVIYYDPATGLYRQSATPLTSPWIVSPFTRTIVATGIDDPVNPQRQVHLVSTVSYQGYANVTKTVTVTDDLYNWFPPLH